ncbi:hypothetical protein AB6A40_002935 [Gnathostoma spinigerum]|uniref:Uncharacterized protein n=1 Tax=Gnathostoma spinigerum TaxID=75299 RepID=A0ABD6EFN9_9BILA
MLSTHFSYNATEFAVSTKSRQLIIYDARTAQVKRSSTLVHDGSMLPHVVHCGRKVENERLITTGNSRNTRRQIAVYHANSIDCPLITVDVDGASGRLIPIADNDLNLLYVAGKGDSNIRFYELYEESPHISYLNESAGTRALTAVGYLPKRGLDVAQCEIMRLFRVDAEQLVIEPMSFIVPRRADSFQVDLFPPTRSPTPALSFAEWFGGLDREPILLELRDCILNCTNKPVTFAKIGFAKKPKLLTSDVNNDRKFRFLAQVTKPDYRSVSDREDCKELLKLREVREKIAAESKANAVIAEDPGDDTVNNKANGNSAEDKKADVGENGISPEVAAMNHRNIFLIDSRSEASEIMDTESLPSENRTENRTGMCRHNRSSVSFDESHLLSTRKRNGVRDKPAYKVISPLVHPKPKVKSPDEDYVWPSEETKSNSQSESEEMLVNVISELEKELSKCRCRCQQLETFVRTQEKDIESLRFEIQWKDGRIEYLQSQLTELDNARSNSSHSS